MVQWIYVQYLYRGLGLGVRVRVSIRDMNQLPGQSRGGGSPTTRLVQARARGPPDAARRRPSAAG